MYKRIIAAFIAIAIFFTIAGCNKTSTKSEDTSAQKTITSENNNKEDTSNSEVKKLKIATSGSFYPIIFTENNELKGFEYDVWTEVAKRCNLELEFQIISGIDGMFASLDTDKVDSIANQITATDERREKYDFSEVYANNEIRLVVRADDPAKSVKDLQGRKVCIEYGTTLETFFNEYNKDLPEDKKVITVTTDGSIYEDLELGRFDAFPMTVLSFDQVKEKGEYDVKMIGDAIIVNSQAFPFVKGYDPELLEQINQAINEMKEDGSLSELSLKWYKRDVTKSSL